MLRVRCFLSCAAVRAILLSTGCAPPQGQVTKQLAARRETRWQAYFEKVHSRIWREHEKAKPPLLLVVVLDFAKRHYVCVTDFGTEDCCVNFYREKLY